MSFTHEIHEVSITRLSEIRIWTMEGDTVYTLSGHTSFVYSLSVLDSGEIISGGEDRTVRIWKGILGLANYGLLPC